MKEAFNFAIFKQNVANVTERVVKIVTEIHKINWEQDWQEFDEKEHFNDFIKEEEKKYLLETLEFLLDSLENHIFIALDYLELNNVIEKFKSDIQLEKNSNKIDYDAWIDCYYSPKLSFLKRYIDSILVGKEVNQKTFEDNSFLLLERILRGTPKIIHDGSLNPRNEADVQREVYKYLVHIFPDTLREIPIPKIVKTYKPDFGIKSLKCAIEYKFVDSEEEAKKFCGDIFEDVSAYNGYEDWKIFYAVIYMTSPFLTQDQVKEEFNIAGIPKNWNPIVVYGKGGRKPKKGTTPTG